MLSDQKEQLKDKLSFIQRKSQRLTSAIYLVTSFITDREPLKWSIREKVLETNISMRHVGVLYKTDKIVTAIDDLLSLCEVCHGAGYLSDMNCEVFKKEYSAIKELFQKQLDLPALPLLETERQAPKKDRGETHSIDRKDEILKVFKPNTNYSIREVSQAFQGLSAKTIQRDLNLLVEQGVIKKTGERRWSRYFLGV